MKNNLIGISGKIGSGKDAVGKVLQWIVTSKTGFGNGTYSNKECVEWLNGKYPGDTTIQEISGYQIKKYADKLKGGCEYDFPNEFSVKEWETGDRSYRDEIMPSLGISRRDFLLKRGDNCRAIHSDYFVNALFADYKPLNNLSLINEKGIIIGTNKSLFPYWIITDVRFPNEAKAIKDRGGIVIRVDRPVDLRFPKLWKMFISTNPVAAKIGYFFSWMMSQDEEMKKLHRTLHHPSETALDDYEFDHVIDNNGSIEELIEKVKQLNLM